MKTIVNPVQIEKCCLKIKCGTNQGTAFYITPEIIVTAYHVVIDADDSNKIYASTSSGDIECTIRFFDKDQDCCALDIARKQEFLPLLSSIPKVNEKCDIYGYPHQASLSFLNLSGRITQVLINDISDFVVGDLNIDGNFDYEGLSGAPVVINGKVIAIARRQIEDRISAISINKLYDFLLSNKIDVDEEHFYHDIPNQLLDDINTSTPNFTVLNRIDKVLETRNNWYLIKGSPGSGKSTIVASYTPEKENIVVCGRYFTKVPNDNEPLTLRTSTLFFLSALENLISIAVTGYPSPKSESTLETRIQNLSLSLQSLSSYFKEQGKIPVLIIDGLDEVKNLEDFLGVFPLKLPDNIKIILSCTSEQILPVAISNLLKPDQIVIVTPIDLGQCEAFIIRETGKEAIPISAVQAIASKSEGHPLYLRYLVNYLKNNELVKNEEELDKWIDNIPAIGGDISLYYNSIWDRIYSTPDRLWIMITLAQLRQAIPQGELFDMLPQQYQLSFHSHYSSVKYLLHGSSSIEIYHNSFREFINEKTSESRVLANDTISAYCEIQIGSSFSVSNILFHYSLGSQPEKAITKCNQEWVDLCAKMDVSPDMVIADLKKVVDLSLEFKLTTEVIRLLLLLQRIEFRYDSVFAENANLLAQALMAMGRYEAALKYMVREKTLLVSNNEAILFLQMFYENDATKEANALLAAIETRYRRVLDEGMKSKDGFSPEIFALELNALTLSFNKDFHEGFRKFYSLLRRLKKHQDAAEDDGNLQVHEAFYSIREYASSWQCAYTLRRFNFFISAEDMSKESKVKIDSKWSRMRASAIVSFNELNDYNTGVFEKNENYTLLIKDLEYLIKTYGYTEEKRDLELLIIALIEDSTNSSIVIEVANKYLKFKDKFEFRKPNGVDLNYWGIHALYFEFKCVGYVDNENKDPEIINTSYRYKTWEEYITSMIKAIAFTEGKLLRLRSENRTEDLNKVISKLPELLVKIDFSLDERSHWDRAYLLPELVFPIIYSKLTNLIAMFNPERLEELTNHVQTRFRNQLGLYSEGFRSCLYEIARTLVKCGNESIHITDILDILRNHIVSNVQNRWERVPELLRVTELYGLINRLDLADNSFSEVLKTSMGPSWYKEDQLALINTSLSLKLADKTVTAYLKNFAGILDYASGEMTFQRYVRHEKEAFVGSLTKHGKIDKAIEYFRSEVLPSPKQLISNAESNTLDAPRLGDGYCLGARNINEQSGVLELLDEIGDEAHYLKWALCEAFVVNDDVYRYAYRYAKIQAEILNHFEAAANSNLDKMFEDIATIAANELMREHLGDYLRNLGESLTETNRVKLKESLSHKRIKWNLNSQEEQSQKNQKKDPPNRFDHFNKAFEKAKGITSEMLIEQGVNSFSEERISIWMSNWSSSSTLVKENLKLLYTSDQQAISSLRNHINKYDAESWVIVSKLLWFLEKQLTDEQIKIVYDLIADHFSLLIQPTEAAIEKYTWLDIESNTSKVENEICRFIIWLLNHPVKLVNERIENSILNLVKYKSDEIVYHLFDEALSEKPLISTEKSSLLLKKISENNPQIIAEELTKHPSLIDRAKSIKHFRIKKNFLDLAINLNKINHSVLYKAIQDSIPQSIILTGNVNFSNPSLSSVQYEINELDQMQILNDEFCKVIIEKTEEYCGPLTWMDYNKSDKYLKRSFYEELAYDSRFDYLVNYALNVAITPRVDVKNWQEVSEILDLTI